VKKRYIWPDREAILDELIEFMLEYGHEVRIRDQDSLDAAFSGVEQYYEYNEQADSAELAAVIFDSIAQRHPLIDGNQRLAWLSATVFLDMNGAFLDARDQEAHQNGIALIKKEITLQEFASFFRVNLYLEPDE
jgi:death-on-curing protein